MAFQQKNNSSSDLTSSDKKKRRLSLSGSVIEPSIGDFGLIDN